MAAKTLSDVKRGYENWHDASKRTDAPDSDLQSPWYAWARRVLTDLHGRSVLEIACGRGALVGWMAARGAHVVGCDISENALTVARMNGGGHYAACDIEHLPFAENQFDVIVCCETLEHTLDPEAAVRELVRVARPDAILLISTPSYLNTYGLYRIYLWLRSRPYGAAGVQPIDRVFFAPGMVLRLRRHGLSIRHTEGFEHYLRPARSHVEFIERSPRLRRWLKHLALHFAVLAQVRKK